MSEVRNSFCRKTKNKKIGNKKTRKLVAIEKYNSYFCNRYNATQQNMNDTSSSVFDQLFRRTYPKLCFYACGLVGNANDADDVVQEVFVELWKRRADIEFGDSIEAFLYRAVFNRAINLLKRRHVSRSRIASLEEINERRMEYYAASGGDPLSLLENADLNAMVQQAIGELPAKCRQAFSLSYLGGMRNSEVAARMGVSVRTVESHIFHALRYLRDRLEGARELLVTIILIFLANIIK